MQILGFVLLVIGLVAAIAGLLQHLKAKKILAAPFRKTGEALNPGAADEKGIVSFEGQIAMQQPQIAPCSGRPCLYYEIQVEQKWEKSVVTEDGVKTEKGKQTASHEKVGGQFFVNDGSGPVAVDASQGMDCELDQSFEQSQNVSYGDVVFGQYRTHISPFSDERNGVAVIVTEKIVPAEGNLFVMGKVGPGVVTKPDGMLGTLRASRRGRDALIGSTKKKALAGFIAGPLMLLPGAGLAIFADPPEPSKNFCDIVDQSAPGELCTGKITDDDGYNANLKVTKGGTFSIKANAPAGKKIPLIAIIGVKDKTGKAFASEEHETASVDLPAGDYTINIRDGVKGAPAKFKGGFSFELAVKQTGAALPVASASATPALSAAAASSTPAAATAPVAAKVTTPAKPAAKAAAPAAKPAGSAKKP